MTSSGRHRTQRARRGLVRRTAGAATLSAAVVLGVLWLPQSASAVAPIQVGWWNTLSGGGQSLPQPDAPAGGLHVAAIPNQDLAYGGVLYTGVPDGSTATLEFKITTLVALPPPPNPNAPPSPDQLDRDVSVVACPTTTNTWKSGDDQPKDAGPGYDCDAAHFLGQLSADQKTMSFFVDTVGQTVPGTLSLAILPLQYKTIPQGVGDAPVDTTEPFSVDFDKPGDDSLIVTSEPVPVESTGGGGGGGGGDSLHQSDTTTTTQSGGEPVGGSATGGNIALPSGNLPRSDTSAANTAPVIAPTSPPAATQAAPTAAVTPTDNETAKNTALVLLILLGIALMLAGQRSSTRSPRLLGGAGRHAPATPSPALAGLIGAAAGGLTAEQTAALLAATAPSRGLGRFAKPRLGEPRPLI